MKLELLAESLPLPIQFESRRKKLRRFLRLEIITIEKIWFPCLKELLKKEERFSINGLVYVAIDRTSWGVINILMVSLEMSIAAYQRRFDIEEMFRDFKSGGYSLEGSGLSEKYLSKLLIVVSIAYTSATLQGKLLKKWAYKNMWLDLKLENVDNADIAVSMLDNIFTIGFNCIKCFKKVLSS